MTIKIKDREVTLKYTFRSLILYENIQNKSFSPESTTDVLIYMFCIILTSDKELDLKFDEFLDLVDENPNLIVQFSDWLTNELNKDSMLSPQDDESLEDEDKKKVNS